jgi:hypothetical protein
MGAYDRIRVEGQTLNRRTNSSFQQAKRVYYTIGGTGSVHLFQGSYTGDVDESAGTHLGGGATDTGLSIPTAKNWRLWLKALRLCMFAAFDRPDLPGHWDHHNHALLLGDRELSGSARRQVQDYYAGRNALANHALEPASTFRPPVLFNALYPLPWVDLSNVKAQAKARPRDRVEAAGVKRIQRALNLKIAATIDVDGRYGRQTRTAMARYETMIGGDGNGIPGMYSLTLLGAGRFNVKE